MFYIDVPDINDSVSALSIDGKEYVLRFTYNETYDYWSFGLYVEDKKPIIAMTKIVPNFPILHYYTDTNIPNGIFGCIADSGIDRVGRNAFKNKIAEFVYIPNVELEE